MGHWTPTGIEPKDYDDDDDDDILSTAQFKCSTFKVHHKSADDHSASLKECILRKFESVV